MVGPFSPSQLLYLALIGAVALERLFELRLSRRNVQWAMERGGLERGQGHFRLMTLMHIAFLVACPLEVLLLQRPFVIALALPMLALAFGAQALRYWAISSLGRRWNVRVVVLPGEPALRRGPYRWLRHPNYVAVVVEILALPLVHGAWLSTLLFSALNAWLLFVRIRCEEAALSEHASYETIFPSRGPRTAQRSGS